MSQMVQVCSHYGANFFSGHAVFFSYFCPGVFFLPVCCFDLIKLNLTQPRRLSRKNLHYKNINILR